jgi:hypothetical protein
MAESKDTEAPVAGDVVAQPLIHTGLATPTFMNLPCEIRQIILEHSISREKGLATRDPLFDALVKGTNVRGTVNLRANVDFYWRVPQPNRALFTTSSQLAQETA